MCEQQGQPTPPAIVIEEHQKKAFDSALDLTKLLITLATGTLALTATFIKDILHVSDAKPAIPYKWLLFTTWGLMLFSVFWGLLAIGTITGTLDDIEAAIARSKQKKLTVFSGNIKLCSASQSLLFYIGIVCLIIYAAMTL